MSDELESLRNKNRELLDEVKKARAKLSDQQELAEKLDAAEAKITELTLHKPVRDILGQVFTVQSEHAMRDVMDDFNFELTDDGIAIHDKDGKPLKIGDDEVEVSVDGLTKLLSAEEKYAAIVKPLARNEPMHTAAQSNVPSEPTVHFGWRGVR